MIPPKLLATMTLAAAIAGAIGVADAQTSVELDANGPPMTIQGATGSAEASRPDAMPGTTGKTGTLVPGSSAPVPALP